MSQPVRRLWRRLQAEIDNSRIVRTASYTAWSILAGLASGYALPPKLFPGIEWLGLLPLLLMLRFPFRSWRERFFYGWVAGSAAMGLYTTWFFSAFPLTWLQLDHFWAGVALTLIAWFTVGVIVPGASGGLFLIAAQWLLRGTAGDALRLSLLVAAVDYLRTFYLAGHPFTLGAGSLFGDNWAVNVYAYAIADYQALRQIAAVAGLYALSFVAALPSAIAFIAVRALLARRPDVPAPTTSKPLMWGPTRRWRGVLLAAGTAAVLFLFLAAIGPELARSSSGPGRQIRIAIVSSAFLPEDWELGKAFFAKAARAFGAAVREAAGPGADADVILLPEGSTLASTTPGDLATFGKAIPSLAGNGRYRVLVNLLPRDELPYGASRPSTNDIQVFDSSGALIGIYSKQFLMPFGEYMPKVFDLAWRLSGQTQWLDQHAPRWRVPGSTNGVFKTPLGTLGILGCSEIISPHISRNTVRDGAEILLYTASIAILRNSERLHHQNIAVASIRAAETRRYVAYAANGGRSFFIGPDGTLEWASPAIAPGVKIVEARLNRRLTPAVRYPNWFPFLAIGALALDGFRRRDRTRK